MKHISRLCLLSIATLGWITTASASTLDSTTATVTYVGYSSTLDNPTSTFSLTTFNLGQTGLSPWHNAIGTSDWVSFEAGTGPGGSNANGNPNSAAPNGTYTYAVTINVPVGDSGTITAGLAVLADDTTSVYLNGLDGAHQIIPSASGSGTAGTCTTGQPNCTAVDLTLPTLNLVVGTNTLYFAVDQIYGFATGLDFEGTEVLTINQLGAPTPEPSSLALLGTRPDRRGCCFPSSHPAVVEDTTANLVRELALSQSSPDCEFLTEFAVWVPVSLETSVQGHAHEVSALTIRWPGLGSLDEP